MVGQHESEHHACIYLCFSFLRPGLLERYYKQVNRETTRSRDRRCKARVVKFTVRDLSRGLIILRYYMKHILNLRTPTNTGSGGGCSVGEELDSSSVSPRPQWVTPDDTSCFLPAESNNRRRMSPPIKILLLCHENYRRSGQTVT